MKKLFPYSHFMGKNEGKNEIKTRVIYVYVSTPGRALRSALRDPHKALLCLDLCREALGFWEKEEDKKKLR